MSSTRPITSTGAARAARRPQALAAALAGAAGLVVLLLVGGGAPQPSPGGLPDPGPLTGWSLPALDLLGQVSAVVVVGCLMVPLLTMRRLTDPALSAACRAVAPVAALWALVALAQVVLTYSDQAAVPLAELSPSAPWLESSQAQALLAQAALAVALAVVATRVRTVRGAGFALALALVAVVPPLLTGHAAGSTSGHGVAEIGLLWHVLAAVVWAGGVVALWWHLEPAASDTAGSAGSTTDSTTDTADRAARRFSGLAAWCFGAVAVSGVVTAWTRIGSLGDLATGYGAGVVAKTVVLLAVAGVAVRLRGLVRRSGALPWRRFAGLTSIEVTLMAVAFGLGAALARTPTPTASATSSAAENLIGGPVPDPVTLGRVLWSWQLSGVGLSVVLLGATAYAVGVWRLRRRGDAWSAWRTASFAAGLLVVLWSTSGGLGVYATVMFSVHMLAHMALSMLAPILIVLGAPITLALRALPGADVPGGTGPRQMLSAALRSRPAAVLTHPAVVGLLFVGALYAVYLGGMFDPLMDHHLGHAAMELHFLLAGLLFYEVLIGDSPVRRLPYIARIGFLMVTIAFHAFFAVALMASETIVGERYYTTIGFTDDLLADQYLAGSATWALGEVPMVLLIVVMLLQWWRSDSREAKRHDRTAKADAELAAYNEMLARASAADDR